MGFADVNWIAVGIAAIFNVAISIGIFKLWPKKDKELQAEEGSSNAPSSIERSIFLFSYSIALSYFLWLIYISIPSQVPDVVRASFTLLITVIFFNTFYVRNSKLVVFKEILFYFLSLWGTAFLYGAFF